MKELKPDEIKVYKDVIDRKNLSPFEAEADNVQDEPTMSGNIYKEGHCVKMESGKTYRINEYVDRGSFGDVYKVTWVDTHLDTLVPEQNQLCIKVYRRDKDLQEGLTPELCRTFMRNEIDKLRQLKSSGLLKRYFNYDCFDCNWEDGVYVMEYFDGLKNLDDWTKNKKPSCKKIIDRFKELKDFFYTLHSVLKFEHGDMSTGNIIIDGDGKTKILDFGSCVSIYNRSLLTGNGTFAPPTPFPESIYTDKTHKIIEIGESDNEIIIREPNQIGGPMRDVYRICAIIYFLTYAAYKNRNNKAGEEFKWPQDFNQKRARIYEVYSNTVDSDESKKENVKKIAKLIKDIQKETGMTKAQAKGISLGLSWTRDYQLKRFSYFNDLSYRQKKELKEKEKRESIEKLDDTIRDIRNKYQKNYKSLYYYLNNGLFCIKNIVRSIIVTTFLALVISSPFLISSLSKSSEFPNGSILNESWADKNLYSSFCDYSRENSEERLTVTRCANDIKSIYIDNGKIALSGYSNLENNKIITTSNLYGNFNEICPKFNDVWLEDLSKKEIVASYSSINDLFKYFPQLDTLIICNCDLSGIDSISSSKLTSVELRNCNITDISFLANCPNLRCITVTGKDNFSLSLPSGKPFSNVTHLALLDFENIDVSNLYNTYPALSNVMMLNTNFDQRTLCEQISMYKAITKLYLNDPSAEIIAALGNKNNSMNYIGFSNTDFSNESVTENFVEALCGMENLKQVYLDNCSFYSLEPFEKYNATTKTKNEFYFTIIKPKDTNDNLYGYSDMCSLNEINIITDDEKNPKKSLGTISINCGYGSDSTKKFSNGYPVKNIIIDVDKIYCYSDNYNKDDQVVQNAAIGYIDESGALILDEVEENIYEAYTLKDYSWRSEQENAENKCLLTKETFAQLAFYYPFVESITLNRLSADVLNSLDLSLFKRLDDIKITNCGSFDCSVFNNGNFDNVEKLYVFNSEIINEGSLSSLASLQEIKLVCSRAKLSSMGVCPTVYFLFIASSDFDDYAGLANFPNLQSVYFSNCTENGENTSLNSRKLSEALVGAEHLTTVGLENSIRSIDGFEKIKEKKNADSIRFIIGKSMTYRWESVAEIEEIEDWSPLEWCSSVTGRPSDWNADFKIELVTGLKYYNGGIDSLDKAYAAKDCYSVKTGDNVFFIIKENFDAEKYVGYTERQCYSFSNIKSDWDSEYNIPLGSGYYMVLLKNIIIDSPQYTTEKYDCTVTYYKSGDFIISNTLYFDVVIDRSNIVSAFANGLFEYNKDTFGNTNYSVRCKNITADDEVWFKLTFYGGSISDYPIASTESPTEFVKLNGFEGNITVKPDLNDSQSFIIVVSDIKNINKYLDKYSITIKEGAAVGLYGALSNEVTITT